MTENTEGVGRGEERIVESGMGDVSAENVTILSGMAGTVEAQTVSVEHGVAGLVKAESFTISDGALFAACGNTACLERSSVVFLAAKEVSGEARILLDWRAAAAFGAVVGLLLGLLRFLQDRDA